MTAAPASRDGPVPHSRLAAWWRQRSGAAGEGGTAGESSDEADVAGRWWLGKHSQSLLQDNTENLPPSPLLSSISCLVAVCIEILA